MYTVVEIGNKQYRAEKGSLLKVEKLDKETGAAVDFDSVLLVADNDQVKVGTPFVQGVRVKAVVEEHGKDRKVIIYKYRPKKNSRKKTGHRQLYTMIRVQDIEGL